MKKWTWAVAAAASALVVAGCGGGGGGTASTNNTGFSQLVSFGDSLSDIGTYNVGTVAAVGGGKFTVNSPTAKNWTQLIAAQYNVPTPCPAQTGLANLLPSLTSAGFVGAATQNFSSCRNYAQGSSRVTVQYAPYSAAVQNYIVGATVQGGGTLAQGQSAAASAGFALGLSAVPVVTQMNTHLTNVGGAYTCKELVTIIAGANDVFMNLNGINAVATAVAGPSQSTIQGAVLGATFAGWTNPNQYASPSASSVSTAQAAAFAAVQQAATDLVTDIKTLVLAKGATHVVVGNLPDISQTPYGISLGAQGAALTQQLTLAFNSTLAAGLNGLSGVLLVDLYTQGQSETANPVQYGLTNVTTPACSTTSAANPLQGSSLTCTAASTIAGDTSHYQYADTVHPTPYGYQLIAQFMTLKLIAAGWQ